MRTNIEIDDKLMDEAIKYGKYSTKKEAVHEALKLLVQRQKQRKIRDYRGKLKWEGDLEQSRLNQ
jgi:Arc/MetJ family transcription regulator